MVGHYFQSCIRAGFNMINNCYNHRKSHTIAMITTTVKLELKSIKSIKSINLSLCNHCRVVSIWSQWSLNLFCSDHSHHSDHNIWLYGNQPLFNPAQLKYTVKMTTYGVPLLSLDHFFSCDSLLIRKIPLPWAEKLTQKN